MSPLSNIRAPKHSVPTTRIEDLQLRTHDSRGSESTATPSLVSSASNTPTLPPPALHRQQRQLNDEALSDFFGGRNHRTRTQPKHHAPPSYSPDWDGEKLPGYTSYPDFESDTVARHLFKYGFLFPFFWAVGVYFLFVPMRVSEDWQSGRTAEEREHMLSEMRATETKWARRCLWALLSFIACLAIVIVAVVVSRH